MTRVDRILACYDGVILPGLTLDEADAAVSVARLDLEASRAANGRPSVRALVEEFLRELEAD